MLTMQALSRQGLPHDIPPEASADYGETGWTGGFERDGSERYRYTSPDGTLGIKISENFCDEPNEELGPDHPDYWAVNKEYSDWDAECTFPGEGKPRNPGGHRTSNLSVTAHAESMESAQEAVEKIALNVPQTWLDASGASRERILQGWKDSYSQVAGKVHAPMWI